MKKSEMSIEMIFGILLFIVAVAVLLYIFIQVQGESSNLLDLIPV